jgi:hypothetical protein
MNNIPGTWWMRSKKDPRWNADGRSTWVGGFEMPKECKYKFEELKQKLKEEPPDDLYWEYMKD